MYNANYMDDVPVKIAEKYIPPSPIYKLPLSLANKLNLNESYYRDCPVYSYNFQLEQKALSKIEQWKLIRQRNKQLRKERILSREQQRKREDEDRQKNLLYSVSYPSADDLSSGEEEEKVDLDMKNKEIGRKVTQSKELPQQICVTETVSSFHNILQPTVLSFNSSSSAPAIKSTYEGKLSNSFNYKDFEEDTSSPFDNIELKTINDLDVLAQVLHNTQVKSPAHENFEGNKKLESNDKSNENSNNWHSEQEHYNSLTPDENIPKPNNNLPRFNCDLNSTQEASTHLNHYSISTAAMQYNANLSPPPIQLYNGLTNSNDIVNYQLKSCNQTTNKTNNEDYQAQSNDRIADDQTTKSKSVPDILKELRDEVRNSEIRRHEICSYNHEESTKNVDVHSANEAATKSNDNEDFLSQLDSNAKQLVEQISAMGFPVKRVARIVQLLGTDDKKVIEHLIPLSELADLGFEECEISDALMRNANSKNKALDDLIS